MKIKKIAAAALALTLIGGTMPITDALSPETVLTAQAADAATVLPSIPTVSSKNAAVYAGTKNASFRMGGRTYNQGVTMAGSSLRGSEITFDVSDAKSFSFMLGHVEDADKKNTEMKIYVDDKLTDTLSLTWTMTAYKYSLDVSKASQVSFVIEEKSSGKYGLGDITTDKEKPAISSSGTNYKDMNSVLVSAFDTNGVTKYYGTDKSKSFNMCGREYYEGLVYSVGYKGTSGTASFNVEDCTKFACSLGHIDEAAVNSGTFNFYIDDKLAKSEAVEGNGNVQDVTVDIPDGSSCLRIEFVGDDGCSFGMGDITLDKYAIENKNASPVYKTSQDVVAKAYNVKQGEKYTGNAEGSYFNVNGRSYYNGIVFTTYTNNTIGSASFNTENCDKLSFGVGKVDSGNAVSGVLNIYYDNVLKESMKLEPYMNAKKIELDVKDVSNVRAEVDIRASKYAFIDITADDIPVDMPATSPEYKASKELLEKMYGYSGGELRVYTDSLETDSFKMSGRTYYDGFTITQGGSDNGLKVYNICMNVENIDKISWDTGFVDDADYFHESMLNVYLDNEIVDKIDLNRNMGIHECSYDVSKASTLRLEFNINSYSAYGIGNLKADKLKTDMAPVIPKYKNVGELLDAGYNRNRVEIFDGKEPDTRSFTMGGKQYDTGIKMMGSRSNSSFISFNTENVDGLKFTMVYQSDSTAKLSIYKDNELYQDIIVNHLSEPVAAGIDTKDTDVVRFVVTANGDDTIAIADIEMGEFDPSSLTTTAATTTAVTTTTTTSTPVSRLFGDINGDGIIDGRDATILLTYYAKTSTGYTGSLEQFVDELSGNAPATTTTEATAATTTTKAAETTTKAAETTAKAEDTTAKATAAETSVTTVPVTTILTYQITGAGNPVLTTAVKVDDLNKVDDSWQQAALDEWLKNRE